MYISCIFFKEFLYFKKLPNLVQTLSYFFFIQRLLSSDLKSACLTLLVFFVTGWFIDTKSPNSRNLSCSERLDHSGKQLKWNPEEDLSYSDRLAHSGNQTDVAPFGLDSLDVQAACFITLGVGFVFVWTLACIYDPGFKYLETIDTRTWCRGYLDL